MPGHPPMHDHGRSRSRTREILIARGRRGRSRPVTSPWSGGAGARLLSCGQYCTSRPRPGLHRPADPRPSVVPPHDVDSPGEPAMSSLWTPDGERPVSRQSSDATPGAAEEAELSGDPLRAAAAALGVDLDSLSPDERTQLQAELGEMMRVRREVAATPASEM